MAHARLAETIRVLERLVAFESLPGRPNLDLVGYLKDYLADKGIEGRLSFDDSGTRANLHALIGSPADGGVVLNGHTDVVPVEGQAWTSDPFALVRRDGRLFARGAVDMKGFLACIFASAAMLRAAALKRPVHLTACYDEEIGGLGAPILVEAMLADGPKPAVAIVGEPTAMRLVSGHKGGLEMHTEFLGHSGHASDPRKGVNAIHFAARFVARLTEMAADLSCRPRAGSAYEPPYTTISVGRISGGAARNIIADSCAIDWELRPLPGDDGDAMIAEIERFAREELLPEMRKAHPKADIRTVTEARVPALDESEAAAAVDLVSEITGSNATEVVSFGTDAGHFCRAGISTVVFGPGSIGEAHKPDEFIEVSEIEDCLAFLDRLAVRLSRP
jgi:acetylornithine deacetylase